MTFKKIVAWIRIARLQFYPMTWLAYTVGAVAQAESSGRFILDRYLLGYLILFLIEFCTILANEYYDFDSDRQNPNYSIFTGGTRVLVEGRLSFREVRAGVLIGLAGTVLAGYSLIGMMEGGSPLAVFFLLILGLVLGMGYTVPPVKFSYRGLGELIVGLTHSVYVILCGFVFQGGDWFRPLPWLVGIPLFFAVLAANTLAGIPDRQADDRVQKRSIAVVFGPRPAVLIAMCFVAVAFLSGCLLGSFRLVPLSTFYWGLLVAPHGLLLLFFLFRFLKEGRFDVRIDRIMGIALAYIIWFGLLPLLSLW
jgi:1,4-dihydroxy-2-naphthoate octaprenyltransferase